MNRRGMGMNMVSKERLRFSGQLSLSGLGCGAFKRDWTIEPLDQRPEEHENGNSNGTPKHRGERLPVLVPG